MREIKFEYLCKHTYKGKETFYKQAYKLSEIEELSDIVENIAVNACGDCDGNCTTESCNHCECDSILDHGEFDVIARRQYTGLKDCDGVEIYDGDVIKFESGWDSHVCVVEFYDCKFTFGKQIAGNLGVNDDCCLMDFMCGSGCDEYEVIGNIHQNPELLDQGK